MYVFAEPLTTVIYDAPEAAPFLQILAPFFLLLYFQGPLQAVLQGLDRARTAMMNTLFGAIVKTLAIFCLASQPQFGIYGAAMAINLGVCLVTLLHFFSIVKMIGFSVEVKDFFKVGLAMFGMAYSGKWTMEWYISHQTPSLLIALLFALVVATSIYFFLLIIMKMVGKQDVQRLPLLGPILSPFIPRR